GCVDSGVYIYSLTIPETKYYKQSVLQSNFIISKIRIYIEDKDFINKAIFTYDGLPKSVRVTEVSNNYNVGTKEDPDGTLDPLYDLNFEAVLITKDYKQKVYKGEDSTLALLNYEYTVTDANTGKDVSNNYLIDYSNASIEIMPIPFQYKINHPEYTYDNKDHQFSYYISNPSNASLVHIEWLNEVTGEYQTTPIVKRDVGYYEVKIRMTAENYITQEGIVLPMTIKPAETVIEYVSNLSRVYDGNEVTIPEIIKTSRDDAKEGTLVDRYTYKYYKYDALGNLIPEPIFTQEYNAELEQVVTNGHRAVDVGRYRMEIVIPASANFEGATYSDDFTISSFVTDITWQNLSFVYDGTPKKPTAYLQLVQADKQNGSIQNITIDVTVTPNAKDGDTRHINKGTYTATANLNLTLSDSKVANYTLSEKSRYVTFAIQPRSAMIVLNYPQSLYKGDVDYLMYYAGLNKDGYKFNATNLVPNHRILDYLKLNYDGAREYNKASDFTWMDGGLDVALASQKPRILDENGVNVTDNYLLGYSYLFILNEKITDSAVSILNYNGVFDGLYHTFDIDLLVDEPANFTIKYWVLGQSKTWTTTKPQKREVGQDQIAVRIEDATGKVVFEGTAGINITKAEPEVQFEDMNFRLGKIYDGIPISNPSITYNGTPTTAANYTYYKIAEDGSASRLTSNPVDAGRYRLDVEVPSTKNYNGVVHSFDVFEITPRTITIHISNQSKLFDYLSWTHTVQDYEVENLVKGHTLRTNESSNNGILMTTSPEVGEYTLLGVTPGFQWQNNYLRVYDAGGNEVNGPTKQNYVVNLLANVKIAERQFDVTFKNKIEVLDNTPKIMSAHINGTKLEDGSVDPCIYADFEHEVKVEYAVLENGTYQYYPVEYISRSGIGVYNVRVRISAPNYETLIKEAKLAIVEEYDPTNPPPGFGDDDPDNPTPKPKPGDPDYEGPDDADNFPYLEYDKNKIYDGHAFPDPVYTLEPSLNHDIKYYEWDYYCANYENLDPSHAISAPTDADRYVFVFKIAEDALQFAGEVYEQAFRINPRPVEADWLGLTQQYTGKTLLPTATYKDINNQIVNCVVEPTTGFINKGTYNVAAKTSDTNYRISNASAQFTIASNVIKDLVLLPPDEDYEYGKPIKVKDTDGNTYISKKDTDKDPSLITDPEHTYLIDDNGELLKYDPEKDEWVPAGLPYTMTIDDTVVDPETGEHRVDVTVSLKNPGDDSWEKNGTDDIKQSFPIQPTRLPSEDFDLVFDYIEVWVHTGTPIEPKVTVYLRDLKTNHTTELDPKNYTIAYNNNVDVTTPDSKAEILISSIQNGNYYFDDVVLNFTITASKPDVLELKEDALIQFINATYEEGVTTIIEDGTYEHSMAGEAGFYLGHLHQETLVSEIIAQFKNNPERLIVTDAEGEPIDKELYTETFFATGYTVSLLDENEQVIDEVQGILYGDLNSDGLISSADLSLAQDFVSNDSKFSDVESWYFFAGITDREVGVFSAVSIVDIQSYVDYGSEDTSYDFNTFDGTYPNSYSGTESSVDSVQD
ncbi:MAG: hypothetical protein K2J85_06075, partial [Anaeroplasmataceae bacterium]|nr:hypothetical protein [Anaeroplasmataceae bacterium]